MSSLVPYRRPGANVPVNTMRYRVQAGQVAARRGQRGSMIRAKRYARTPFYRGIIGFPQKMVCRLRYVARATLSSEAGALTNLNFQANNLYAVQSSSHQPMYFDNLMAIYNHYVVLGSKIDITASPNAAGSTNGAVISVFLNDDTTVVPTNIDAIGEQSTARNASLSAVMDFPTKLYCTYSAQKVFGPNAIQNVELKGDATANCADTVVYTVSMQSTSADAVVNLLVEIEYTAVFFELKDQSQN